MPAGRIISGVKLGYVPPRSAGSGIPATADILKKEVWGQSLLKLRMKFSELLDAWLAEQQCQNWNNFPAPAGANGFASLFSPFGAGPSPNSDTPIDVVTTDADDPVIADNADYIVTG